jgi:hypothetical protein
MSCSSDLFVFVWFSDNRRFTVFVRFAAVVLLFFIVVVVGSRGGTAVLAKLCQMEMFTGLRGAMSTLVGCHGFTEGYYYESTAKGDLGVSAAPQSLAGAIAMTVPPFISGVPAEFKRRKLAARDLRFAPAHGPPSQLRGIGTDGPQAFT